MTPVPDRRTFESAYAGQPPWDIGKPQKPFVDVADRITGTVLDAGCGTGDTALFLAGRGSKVMGIDFLEVPIQRAKRKAAERGVQVSVVTPDSFLARFFRRGSGDPVYSEGAEQAFPRTRQRRRCRARR